MIEDAIITSLRQLADATSSSDGEGILSATQSLDKLKEQARGEVDGHLMHFLENRSYQKALQYLETGERQKHAR